jgi:hypothetical protein
MLRRCPNMTMHAATTWREPIPACNTCCCSPSTVSFPGTSLCPSQWTSRASDLTTPLMGTRLCNNRGASPVLDMAPLWLLYLVTRASKMLPYLAAFFGGSPSPLPCVQAMADLAVPSTCRRWLLPFCKRRLYAMDAVNGLKCCLRLQPCYSTQCDMQARAELGSHR